MEQNENLSSEIICVGTELLLGDIINTNSTFLSLRLAESGIPVYRHTSVGDNPQRLKNAIKEALGRVNLVILTGGLGPTYDDLTKETVADCFSKKLVLNESCLEEIKEYFKHMSCKMTENNIKQAYIPEGATVLRNDFGTAPGVAVTENGKTVIMLPGPPRELEPMFYNSVLPYIKKLSHDSITSKFVHLFGIGESAAETALKDLMETSINPTVAPYAKEGEVRLRITAKADSQTAAEKMCDDMIEKIKASTVGQYIYGIDVNSAEQALVSLLKEKGLSISSAESCTGGYIAKRITDIPGSSEVFFGSYITYTNEIKIKNLGVNKETIEKYTEVSHETAKEMADRVRKLTGTDIGISTTGFAGPGGGTAENPVGTIYIGISTNDFCKSVRLSLSPRKSRETIRYVAATNAIMQAIKAIKEK